MKRITAVLCALAVLASPSGQAFASTTRLLSMGLDNWQLHDSANFWSNPALLRDAPDVLHLEAGTQGGTGGAGAALDAGSQWGGFHKAWGRNIFALYVRRPYGTNDFSTIADPLLTPMIGGMVTGAGVIGGTGLDTGAFGNTDFGVDGPFGTGNGTGGSLAITGVPDTLTKDVADMVNFVDAFWAMPIGWFTMGLRFNYARNAPNETRRNHYTNVGSGSATEGTMVMERLSQEFNIQPGFSIRAERVRFDLTGQVAIPYYEMDYEELGPGGRFSRSSIDQASTLGGAAAAQLTLKVKEQASLSFRLRAGNHNAAGTASQVEETSGGGTLETNRSASFDNRRRYIGADMSWNILFEKALLAASIGYQRAQTKQTWDFADALAPGTNDGDLRKVDFDVVPLRIAMEMTPWDRIALRAGIQKNWFAESDAVSRDRDGAAGATTSTVSTTLGEASGTADGVGLSFGMGFRLIQNLSIDTVVRQDFFFDGPDFIGGRAPGLFARGTLVYRFGLSSNADDTLKPLLSYDEIQLY